MIRVKRKGQLGCIRVERIAGIQAWVNSSSNIDYHLVLQNPGRFLFNYVVMVF